MKTEDFYYDLPKEFIAQDPVVPRDQSRLMVFDSKSGQVFHKKFFELGEFLLPGDNLVMNRSRVIPARIHFDNASKEIFLLKKVSDAVYQVLVRPGKFFKVGIKFLINEDLAAEVLEILGDGSRIVKFVADDIERALLLAGETPLPPYISKSKADPGQYQTVYAAEEGSVAAPTAGLHFTPELINNLLAGGVNIEKLLLHVGRGTFLPVSAEDLENHKMHEEEYELDGAMAKRLSDAKNSKKRIIAVGTTSVRVLESCFNEGSLSPSKSVTDIFIYPGKYKWKVVDGLITNFHLPKSTLMMLVASFLENKGVEQPVKKLLELYELAKSEGYRFYSFGDAMMII